MMRRILTGIARHREAGLLELASRGARLLKRSVAAAAYLRDCNVVGSGARVNGRPHVENRGRIDIGPGLELHSEFAPSELIAEAGGALEIGSEVWINFGALIHARRLVQIGDRTMIGQYAIIADTEMAGAEEESTEAPKPVRIGSDVWVAGRVTVLPGVSIGDGSVITAGSVVSSDIPAGVVAGGIPARVLRRISEAPREDEPPLQAPPAPAATLEPAPMERVAPVVAAAPAAEHARLRCLLVSDFTISELAHQLEGNAEGPSFSVEVAPFGQVVQSLLGAASSDLAVVWTLPEATLPTFRKALEFQDATLSDLLAEVDQFCSAVAAAAPRFKSVFVPTWTAPGWLRGLGAIDPRELGPTRALAAINQRLTQQLASAPNVHVLQAQRWFEGSARGYSPRGWYLGKVPFHTDVFAEAAKDIAAALRALAGQTRKLLVFDLDDTLWGGIVGDAGWEHLKLGGHDPEGEALVDLQRAAKALRRRGVLLAIVSKNEESVALEAIRMHPEMVLREDDFAAWRINWTDTARNLAEIAAELNLGLQSVVFIDDNPVERARVREALPEVLVPEWPTEKLLYPSALLGLRCFDAPALTSEDASRTELYKAEQRREKLLDQIGSIDEWLKSLGIRVRAEPLSPANLARAAQLLNKTNQMNLSTRRLTESELLEWSRGPGRTFWAVTVLDRFGDAGLTGLLSLEVADGRARIVDFVLSCRVMGRKVEEAMLHLAVAESARLGLGSLEARHLPTAKNKPCLSFFTGSGFQSEDGGRFVWNLRDPYPLPAAISLEQGGRMVDGVA